MALAPGVRLPRMGSERRWTPEGGEVYKATGTRLNCEPEALGSLNHQNIAARFSSRDLVKNRVAEPDGRFCNRPRSDRAVERHVIVLSG